MKIIQKICHMINRLVFDSLANTIASSFIVPSPVRFAIYKMLGLKTSTARIRAGCFFNGKNITIGKGTFINYRGYFDNTLGIEIGENCALGMEVLLCTSSHEIGDELSRAGKTLQIPIIIEDGCWIGARATILPGVRIGRGCVIAAGAVVNKDCEPNGIYAGVPAKRVKELPIKNETIKAV